MSPLNYILPLKNGPVSCQMCWTFTLLAVKAGSLQVNYGCFSLGTAPAAHSVLSPAPPAISIGLGCRHTRMHQSTSLSDHAQPSPGELVSDAGHGMGGTTGACLTS